MKEDEKILVLSKDIIFKEGSWQGVKIENLNYYLDLIRNNYQFKKRGEVENDDSFQQIIPYILFSFEDKFFLYKYLEKAGEQRLRKDYMLGVGGHINPIDIKSGKDILEIGTMREWNEEVDYRGNILSKKLVGILNDESRPVERVHLGLIYHFIGDSPEISVKETDNIKGELVDLKNLGECMKNSQGWAPIIYKEYLSKLV